MTFIVRILRYLFWVVIVSWSFRLLRRLVSNMATEGARTEPEPDVFVPQDSCARKLVRDPVCGMHMAETIAIPLRNGNELLHFCSAECREKYVQGTQKLTASA